MKKSHQLKINSLEDQGVEVQDEMRAMMQKYEDNLSQVNHDLSIERSKAENYWTELEHLRSKSMKQDELRQVEIKLLEESVRGSKAQLKSKEGEILNLKSNELKNAKDRAARLEEKVMEMEKVFEQSEMDGAMVVDDLNKKLVDAVRTNAELENEKSAIIAKSRKASETLESKIKSLETRFVAITKELESRSKQLSERDEIISNLKREKMQQEESVESWKGDLDMLIAAYEKCKTDHAAIVKNLQSDYHEFKEKAQHDAAMFEKDYESLQSLAAETEAKYEQQSHDMKKIKQQAAEEKKRVIREMTQCQEEKEQELREARNVIAELQDVSENFSKQCEEYKSRYQSLQLQMEVDLKRFMDEIERREEAHKDAQKKLSKMEREISDLREELKTTDELRATNYLLQDKVGRQEAFLKRKLEKEKKQRMIPPSSTPRSDPRRSRSVTRRQPDSQTSVRAQPKVTRSRSHSRSHRMPPTDDELDDLLS